MWLQLAPEEAMLIKRTVEHEKYTKCGPVVSSTVKYINRGKFFGALHGAQHRLRVRDNE